ncbi:MAG: CinA family nicotinamide mononucleotide deamidase-related protein [Desulfuromonadales bacterium]|nr:CinA family nicotinamide mononucleotide deamidase-related protein [Desulfuromonadales bacterium]
MSRIAVLTIGDELLNGDLPDSNTADIGRLLAGASYQVIESVTVGDDDEQIATALQRLAGLYRVVIVTGGLGPTDDDRTARAAARACGRPLQLNDRALAQIRERFRERNRPMHPRNEKQALLPARATVLTNRLGTAPGFHLRSDSADLYFLPGVPSEMRGMLVDEVLPAISRNLPEPTPMARQILSVYGLAEPEVEERIVRHGLPSGVDLAFAVNFGMVEVKLFARGPEAASLVDRGELQVRQALGDFVVGVGTETLAGNTARLLLLSECTLALAESCTGGLIAELLTGQPGASGFLERAVVTYANSAKTALLGVPAELLEQHGAVSADCARAMARGVRERAATDIGLAVTGIAGPDGGNPEKPVGTVFIALDSAGEERVERFRFHGDRHQIRLRSAHAALDWLRRFAGGRVRGNSYILNPAQLIGKR